MAQHRKNGPSSAKRWINCPGSGNLIGDDVSVAGEPAMRGTAAHKIIEAMVSAGETEARAYHGRSIIVPEAGDDEAIILDVGAAIPKGKMKGWRLFIADDAMCDGVQIAIDECERLKEVMFQPEVFTERFLDMSWLDPSLGGTADLTLVEPFGWAHLLDYKNGWVLVDHVDNDQTKNYAVGILHEHPDAEGVRVTIIQPNAFHEEGHVRTVEYTRDELKLYEISLKIAAERTYDPNAPRIAGDHCLWCPAKTRCPEFQELQEREAQMEFSDDPAEVEVRGGLPVPYSSAHDLIDPQDAISQIADKARWIPLFDKWKRELLGELTAHLMAGAPVPGWKLVQGKSNRKWGDENAVAFDLDEIGLAYDDIHIAPTLKSPAQMEKLGEGKEQRKAVKKAVAQHAFKPEGKITIAQEHDPREALDPVMLAGAEFAEDPEDDPWG